MSCPLQVLEAVLGLSSNLTSLPAPLLTEAQADSRATKRYFDYPPADKIFQNNLYSFMQTCLPLRIWPR